MRLNFLFYNARPWDGYGRYALYLIRALRHAGVTVTPHFCGAANAPGWLLDEWGVDFSAPTISCLPPYFLHSLPKGSAAHWLLTMTEGDELPDGWAEIINKSDVARVVVPCQHNAEVFRQGGVQAPISVVQGGTEPTDFPLTTRNPAKPYVFLALADRGLRKGWSEVYSAFYRAFGGKTTGEMDVRLMIKCRPGNAFVDMIRQAQDLDARILFNTDDIADMASLYAQADCFVIPSRSEGFGMPHREASMAGLPVITQRHSGMDDGFTEQWAIVVEKGQMQPIPKETHVKGQWRVADTDELGAKMRWCYENPDEAAAFGDKAASWLRQNQTWTHSASALLQVLQQEGVFQCEMEYA